MRFGLVMLLCAALLTLSSTSRAGSLIPATPDVGDLLVIAVSYDDPDGLSDVVTLNITIENPLGQVFQLPIDAPLPSGTGTIQLGTVGYEGLYCLYAWVEDQCGASSDTLVDCFTSGSSGPPSAMPH